MLHHNHVLERQRRLKQHNTTREQFASFTFHVPTMNSCGACDQETGHYEFWEYCQSTNRVQAYILQKLKVQEAFGRNPAGENEG